MPSRTASRTLTASRARSLTLTRYWLSVSDLVSSFVYIVDGATTANEEGSARCPNGGCVLLASLSQVFNLSAIVWNTYIALNMHLTVLRAARIVKDEPRYMRRLHAGAWGTALLSALTTAGGRSLRKNRPGRMNPIEEKANAPVRPTIASMSGIK